MMITGIYSAKQSVRVLVNIFYCNRFLNMDIDFRIDLHKENSYY